MPPHNRPETPPPRRTGADGTPTSALDQRAWEQATTEAEAAADIRDCACRLALRTTALGFADFDDVLDVIKAVGRLADAMVRGTR
jgi:hypothetical protein